MIRRLAWTAVAVAVLVSVGASPASGAPAPDRTGTASRPVVLVLVRDLTWRTAPPSLDRFAKASLSMRSAGPRSGAEDTYLTLGKGNRSDALPDGAGVGRVEPSSDGGLRLTDWQELQDRDAGLRFGGALGSVGDALRTSGRRWAVATDDDRAVAAVAADADGVVPRAFPGTTDGVRSAIEAQPDVVVAAVPASRLPEVLDLLDPTCTLVVSASTPGENRHLGVLAASRRCGLGTAGLASPSTQHAHLATLPDVSATLLALVDVPRPESLGGAAVTPTVPVDRETLVDRDDRSWTADRARTGFVWLFIALHAVGAIVVLRIPRARRAVCATLLSIPAAGFLMMLVRGGGRASGPERSSAGR